MISARARCCRRSPCFLVQIELVMLPGLGRRALKPAAAPHFARKENKNLIAMHTCILARPAHPYHMADKVNTKKKNIYIKKRRSPYSVKPHRQCLFGLFSEEGGGEGCHGQ